MPLCLTFSLIQLSETQVEIHALIRNYIVDVDADKVSDPDSTHRLLLLTFCRLSFFRASSCSLRLSWETKTWPGK